VSDDDPRFERKHRRAFRGDSIIFIVQVQEVLSQPYATPNMEPADQPVAVAGRQVPHTPAVPQNLSGWYLWSTLKRQVPDPDSQAVAQVTSTPSSTPAGPNGGIVLNAPAATYATVTYPPQATAPLEDAAVVLDYDVQAKDAAGNVYTVEIGDITVYPDVTRALS
jgi:hypothetical protein